MLMKISCRIYGSRSRDLFIPRRSDIEIDFGDVVFFKQLLGRLKDAHQCSLGIDGSPAPDLAIGDLAAEGRMFPLPLGGNHVLVTHEEHRLALGFSLEAHQKSVFNRKPLKGGEHLGKELCKDLLAFDELLFMGFSRFTDRFHLNHLREQLGILFFPFGHWRAPFLWKK
ncbi:MAG: hypothetical protein BWY50_02152 [Spirochaetes bacterium ADurb.Bin315]|nr:MAG: hypothetical protein BWY50_02152 [Spirochaetes bacterium ADurb.Bin315]